MEIERKIETIPPEVLIQKVSEKRAEIENGLKVEDDVEESHLLKRLNSRRESPAVIETFADNQIVIFLIFQQNIFKAQHKSPRITSAQRKFHFENAREFNAGTYNELSDRFSKLKSLIQLEITHNQITDIPPIRDYEFYIQLFGKGDRTQVTRKY